MNKLSKHIETLNSSLSESGVSVYSSSLEKGASRGGLKDRLYMYIFATLFVLLSMPASASGNFSGDRLEEAVKGYIKKNVTFESQIKIINNIKDFSFREDDIKARLSHSEELRGFSHISIIFFNETGVVKELKIPVKIRLFGKAWTASEAISRGDILRNDNIHFTSKELTDYSRSELPDKDELIGRNVKHTVHAGRILTEDDLQQEKIIRRGSRVTIVVESGAVRIRASGTALNDASTGEIVRVKRDGTRNKVLQGTAAKDGSILIRTNNDRASK